MSDVRDPASESNDDVLSVFAAADAGATFSQDPGPVRFDVARVSRDGYLPVIEAAVGLGFATFIDLCAVDFLRERPRFEVVVNVMSQPRRRRLRVRVPVPGDEPSLPSITPHYPGANFYERETFDMFGIRFEGHPDLTRILMPDDWSGHPLRKDYAVGSVPIQFKASHKAR